MENIPILPTSPAPLPSIGRATSRLIPIGAHSAIKRVLQIVMDSSGLTQVEVARRMGVRIQSVNQYLRGYRENPSLPWLLRFLHVNGAALVVQTGRKLDVKLPEKDMAGRLPMPPRDLPPTELSSAPDPDNPFGLDS